MTILIYLINNDPIEFLLRLVQTHLYIYIYYFKLFENLLKKFAKKISSLIS